MEFVYTLLSVWSADQQESVQRLIARTDADAVEGACACSPGAHIVEVWRDSRLIAHIARPIAAMPSTPVPGWSSSCFGARAAND